MAESPEDGPDTLQVGTILGRYEIRRLIGRGGMGSVYEAEHRDLKKRVAIKTLLATLSSNPEARQRFLREGEAASRIRHPHVVDVTDFGTEGSLGYLVMEFLEGEDLASFIARRGPLPSNETADVMLPVTAAIATAHQQGVIHRDLKPENIFLCRSPYGGVFPKVLDFGISKVTGGGGTMALTGTGYTLGTTYYISPELVRGARQADAHSDQYALGTILYECITGARAFEGENLYAILNRIGAGQYVPVRSRQPDVNPQMEAIIGRAMNVEPAARFSSVEELGAALLEFASPGARAVWGPVFGAHAASQASAPSPSPAGDTMILPTKAAAALAAKGRAGRPTPGFGSGAVEAPVKSSTTLRHATGESAVVSDEMFPQRRSRTPLFAAITLLAIAGGAGAWVMSQDEPSRPPSSPPVAAVPDEPATSAAPTPAKTFQVEIVTEPRGAAINLDGRYVGSGSFNDDLPLDGSKHTIVARAVGYREAEVEFTDRSPPRVLKLEPIRVPTAELPRPAATTPPAKGATAGATRDTRRRAPGRADGPGQSPPEAARRPPSKSSSKPAGPNSPALPNGAPIIE